MRLYQTLLFLLTPVIVLLLMLDTRKRTHNRSAFWQAVKQRLGFGYHFSQPQPIWIHAASVGELHAAEPLIQALLEQHHPLLLTLSTPTAYELAQQKYPTLSKAYLPFDWQRAVNRFLAALPHRPTALWVMETEIWPNLYRQAHQADIPIHIVNARLSQKTLSSPQWLQTLYRQTLSLVTQVLARDADEAHRFQQLGVPQNKIKTLGNLKFAHYADLKAWQQNIPKLSEKSQNPQNSQSRMAKLADFLPQTPFILLASSHEDEELQIAKKWLALKQRLNLPHTLVIVPRHPQRGEAILKSLNHAQMPSQLFSQHTSDQPAQAEVYIVDAMGVMLPLFAKAECVIMGGSFVPKGGHNILEPAALGKPVFTGPDMSDFESETQLLLQAKGLEQVENDEELMQKLEIFLKSPVLHPKLGQNAQKIIEKTAQATLQSYLSALIKG